MIVVVVVVPLSPPRKIKRAGERGWEIKGGGNSEARFFPPFLFLLHIYCVGVCLYMYYKH